MHSSGKPYSRRARAKMLKFVDDYNAQHGRGGQSAAAEKFGVSRMSLFNWQHEGEAQAKKSSARKTSAMTGKERDQLRATLKKLDKELAAALALLASLQAQLSSLLDSL